MTNRNMNKLQNDMKTKPKLYVIQLWAYFNHSEVTHSDMAVLMSFYWTFCLFVCLLNPITVFIFSLGISQYLVHVFQTVLKNQPVCLDGSQLACSLAALPTEQVILRETWLKRVRAHQQFKHRRGVWRAKRLQDESAYIVFAGDLTANGHCFIQQCVVKSSALMDISPSFLSSFFYALATK